MTDTTAGEGVVVPRDLLDKAAFALSKTVLGPQLFAALAAQPSAGAQGEAVAWRVEYRMPNGRMAGTALFGSKAAADFTRSEATLETTITPLYATPAQPDTGDVAALREADRKWLAGWLSHEKQGGHCGEGTFERRERADWNDRIDRILAALSKPNAQGREG